MISMILSVFSLFSFVGAYLRSFSGHFLSLPLPPPSATSLELKTSEGNRKTFVTGESNEFENQMISWMFSWMVKEHWASIQLLGTPTIALWVKSGNRWNLKCLKVNKHFALIFYQKILISFLSDAKLPKVSDWFLGLIIHVKYLRSYLQKTWRGGLISLKFCTLAN